MVFCLLSLNPCTNVGIFKNRNRNSAAGKEVMLGKESLKMRNLFVGEISSEEETFLWKDAPYGNISKVNVTGQESE